MNCSVTDCEYCPYYDNQYDRCGFDGDVFENTGENTEEEVMPVDEFFERGL
jgi:hypothetical protein